ncbi:type II toxin-antitoxin system HicB family antitoxin [Nocardiopsis sp. NPDC049922]|uniref:type II toxin-antitoxin system HicB family antitoxin n=1 Tax=Nocardiopsis sp. NPDC049922 TaxID=3155157 RepID=UPI0033D9E618
MTPTQHHYEAWCERDGRSWSVDIPELRIHTYGHTLVDAEEMARDAIAGVLDVPAGSVTVSLHVEEVEDQLAEARAARSARAQAAAREKEALAKAVAALRAAGASQRDAALLLGVSHLPDLGRRFGHRRLTARGPATATTDTGPGPRPHPSGSGRGREWTTWRVLTARVSTT